MFYSVVNKNEIMKFPSKWMELENILSWVTYAERQKFSITCGSYLQIFR